MSSIFRTETNESRRSTGEIQEDDYSWTAGNDPGVVHIRLIDCGATGEVHEVSRSSSFTNILDEGHSYWKSTFAVVSRLTWGSCSLGKYYDRSEG